MQVSVLFRKVVVFTTVELVGYKTVLQANSCSLHSGQAVVK